MFSEIRASQNITTCHKRQRGNSETPIGTEDAISIDSGFKRLENELDGLLSEDQVITPCRLRSKYPTSSLLL